MQICPQDLCTGCGACVNACPKDAISYDTQVGIGVIHVDRDLCIHCNRCLSVCPVNHPPKQNAPLACYAAWTKNATLRKACASGGIATTMAQAVIENAGVVYGTRFSGTDLIFDRTQEDATKFLGSKYVQANVLHTYREVKQDLACKKQVLFIGTPCQVGALKNYLGKEDENLLTVDLICHGTPPISYLKDHIQNITDQAVTNVSFRGEKNFFLTLYHNNSVIYSQPSKLDPYFSAFLSGILFRENCYACPYAQAQRVGDITIGDFWGLDHTTMQKRPAGRVSAVLINTGAGQRFWNTLDTGLDYEKRDAAEAIAGNAQLQHPSKKHKDRALFLKRYETQGFACVAKLPSVRLDRKQFLQKTRLNALKYKIRKLLGG